MRRPHARAHIWSEIQAEFYWPLTSCLNQDVIEVCLLIHEGLDGLDKLALDRAAHAAIREVHPLPKAGFSTLLE